MNNNLAEDQELIYNTSKRIPVCICVDVGAKASAEQGSRFGEANVSEILSQVEEGIRVMYRVMKKSDMVRESAEVAVVGFSKDVTLFQGFTGTSTFSKVEIPVQTQIDESTNIGAGVLCGLDMFQKRKQIYGSHGVDYHTPWLVLVTSEKDMNKDLKQNVEVAKKQTLLLEKQNKLTMITVYIDSNDKVEIDPKNVKLGKKQKSFHVELSKNNQFQIVTKNKIVDFFEWLGKSINTKAFDNEIRLDFSGLIDWEDI